MRHPLAAPSTKKRAKIGKGLRIYAYGSFNQGVNQSGYKDSANTFPQTWTHGSKNASQCLTNFTLITQDLRSQISAIIFLSISIMSILWARIPTRYMVCFN